MHHPYTTQLALLVVAEERQARDWEAAVYKVVDCATFLNNRGFESKADLYARIVESTSSSMPLTAALEKISAALYANYKEYPHG